MIVSFLLAAVVLERYKVTSHRNATNSQSNLRPGVVQPATPWRLEIGLKQADKIAVKLLKIDLRGAGAAGAIIVRRSERICFPEQPHELAEQRGPASKNSL
jgi:hypothetical protein